MTVLLAVILLCGRLRGAYGEYCAGGLFVSRTGSYGHFTISVTGNYTFLSNRYYVGIRRRPGDSLVGGVLGEDGHLKRIRVIQVSDIFIVLECYRFYRYESCFYGQFAGSHLVAVYCGHRNGHSSAADCSYFAALIHLGDCRVGGFPLYRLVVGIIGQHGGGKCQRAANLQLSVGLV